MSRIRTIKPEFPQSESVGKLSRDARLLFIMLWTIADDSGRARGNSRGLASLLFPYDDDAFGLIDGWISELDANGFIERYEHDGSRYIQINNWLKHQKIDKPSAPKYPDPREGSRVIDETSRALAVGREGKGKEGKGEDISSASLRSLFERFYRAYPKHVEPKDAEKRFVAAVKGGADPEQIIIAAERYAEAHRLAGTERQFIKAPAVWLNKGGWLSEDLPQPQSKPPPRDSRNGVGNLLAEAYGLNGHGNQENHSKAIRSLPFAGDGEREPDRGDDGGLPGDASGLLAASGFSRM